MVKVIQNRQQFVQLLPLQHSFHVVQFKANHGASLSDLFVQFVGVAGSNAASPTNCSKDLCNGNSKLLQNIQHPAAHAKGSQLPQEEESAHFFILHTLSVNFPVLYAVDVHTQVVLVLLHHLDDLSQDSQGLRGRPLLTKVSQRSDTDEQAV